MPNQLKLRADRLPFEEARPVFIVGCVRSGTTIMGAALRSAGYDGFKEGNVMHLLHALYAAVDQHYQGFHPSYLENDRHFIAHVSREDMKQQIAGLFGEIFVKHMGNGRWLDKSPIGKDMILTCPLILDIFPNARFIFCKRRAIENILSRQRKFANTPFEAYCIHWAETMRAWTVVREQIKDVSVEIDQRDMAVRPQEVADQLTQLLALDSEQRDAVYRVLSSNREEQTRPAMDDVYVNLDRTGWSDEEIGLYHKHCASMMAEFGYLDSYDTLNLRQPIALFFPVPGSTGVTTNNLKPERDGFKPVLGGLQLHPPSPGAGAASVTYIDVELHGHQRFSADLYVDHPLSEPVVFTFQLMRASSDEVIFIDHVTVSALQNQHWQLDFPPLHGRFNIVISTQMAPEAQTANGALAQWKSPVLS